MTGQQLPTRVPGEALAARAAARKAQPETEQVPRASLLCWQGDCHMCRSARCWCGCHGPSGKGGRR
jgi:hypothetical protein